MKFGTVSIIGRPNVGKSSLINALLKTDAVIISPKPQTTRNSIRCIYNDENAQIVFTDTPGLYKVNNSKDRLGTFLNAEILSAIENSDAVLWLIDAGSTKLQPDDYEIAEILPDSMPVILTANKSDRADPSGAFRLYEKLRKFDAEVSVSAKSKLGLKNLISALMPLIPEGEALYDPEILMDATEKFMASEIIREKILMSLHDEVPHCVAVEIEEYKSPDEYPESPNGKARKKLYVRASLITETEGQKKILIGSKGMMIKKIGLISRKSLEEATGFEVFLDLWVKAVPGWRKSQAALKRLGYAQP